MKLKLNSTERPARRPVLVMTVLYAKRLGEGNGLLWTQQTDDLKKIPMSDCVVVVSFFCYLFIFFALSSEW